ncbi:hypothetical protein D6777_04640 [Candidatus Woesearchaeota archaeon]|nr:MAG: hypothetical protein D6777_04640 [Candidatus Woesearchaeota archaeon]
MEREYLVAFVIILAVVTIGLIVTSTYFPKLWSDVNKVADDVLGNTKEKEAKELTNHNVKQILDALDSCKKNSKKLCTCQIENKKPLPTDYRVFFKQNSDNTIIYSIDNEDKIVKLATDEDALKLKGIKLGVAVFARPADSLRFSQKPIRQLSSNSNNLDVEERGIYCYFGTLSKDGTVKPLTIILKGDEDGDWSFPIGPTNSLFKSERSGFLLDQIGSSREDSIFNDIPNILKIDDNRYCFLTTNILEYRYDKEFIFGDNDEMVYITSYNHELAKDTDGRVNINNKDFKDFITKFKNSFFDCSLEKEVSSTSTNPSDINIPTETTPKKKEIEVPTNPTSPLDIKPIWLRDQ